MSRVAEAVQRFRDGYACSQAILAVYGETLGLDRATAMRISAGFAGGMRLGEACGAVTGAFMVLGLHHCSADCKTSAGRQTVYAAVTEFASQFRQRNKTVICRELLGCDIGTPEGRKQAKDRDLFRSVCPKMVEDAAEILEQMMARNQPSAATDGASEGGSADLPS
jgi:C_GCAxxG_C_C family probable redox protein